VDEMTARFLELVDGSKTIAEILVQMDLYDEASISFGKRARWIEEMFLCELIGL
jgi:hypothetical protein